MKKKQNLKNSQMKIKKALIIWGLVLLLAVFAFSAYRLINWYSDQQNVQKELQIIEEKVVIEELNLEESEVGIPLYRADLTELKKINPDTIGYIIVNGTKVSYPVVKGTNNEYYLNHSFNKNYNDAGWIFMDYRNLISDENMVIYGHARLDKTMFGSLGSLMKASWYQEKSHNYISFITQNYTATYQIFSVYPTPKNDNYHIMTDFPSSYMFNLYTDELKAKSVVKFNLKVESNDRIITLSTCKNDQEFNVVHAKLISETEL